MIPRGRVVVALVALTVVVLGVDVSRPAVTAPLREAAATVVGPVQRALSADPAPEVTRLTQERDALRRELQETRAQVRDGRGLTDLLRSLPARGRSLVPARVVASSAVGTPERMRRVTIDVGSRDGVTTDLTVICVDGLVGRVVSVAPWTSDVLVLGGRDVTVGVRVGKHHTLGSVSSHSVPGLPPRGPRDLTLTLVQPGSTRVGDPVTTLGSVGGRPFVPGVPVGTVTSVDPAHGQLGQTAVVRPAVDPSTLDVVGVVLSSPRETPRPAVTGAAS
jgi:rod shape-determining protein MreC